MTAKPKFRNFFKHDFLLDAERTKAWTRESLDEIGGGERPVWEAYIFVLSPSRQWVFVDNPALFDRTEFCDWLETVSGAAILDRKAWPDLELATEPADGWEERANAMPCRTGPGLWEKLSRAELRHYVEGGDLPDDVDERGKPDKIQ